MESWIMHKTFSIFGYVFDINIYKLTTSVYESDDARLKAIRQAATKYETILNSQDIKTSAYVPEEIDWTSSITFSENSEFVGTPDNEETSVKS